MQTENSKHCFWANTKSGSTIESNLLPDLDSVPGAPYINSGWLWKRSEKNTTHPEHAHDWTIRGHPLIIQKTADNGCPTLPTFFALVDRRISHFVVVADIQLFVVFAIRIKT